MALFADDNGDDNADDCADEGSQNTHALGERQHCTDSVADKEQNKRQNIQRKCALYNADGRRFYHNMLATMRIDGILNDRFHKMVVLAALAAVAVTAADTQPLDNDLGKPVVPYLRDYRFLKYLSFPVSLFF